MLGLGDEEHGDTVLCRAPEDEFCKESYIIPVGNDSSVLQSNAYLRSLIERQ